MILVSVSVENDMEVYDGFDSNFECNIALEFASALGKIKPCTNPTR